MNQVMLYSLLSLLLSISLLFVLVTARKAREKAEGELALLKALYKIKDKHKSPDQGICELLLSELPSSKYIPRKAVYAVLKRHWPNCSSDSSYSIPSTGSRYDNGEAYAYLNLWSRDTAYGKLRYEALDVLILHYKELAAC